jgi:hypothetical protein
MTVRFDAETRIALDDIAQKAGIVYPNGKPRDAELVRVMLVSALLASEPAPVRLAVALYVNSVLALSGFLALTVADLRETIGRITQQVAKAKRRSEIVKDEDYAPSAEYGTDRARVFLILDDLLHRSLVDYLEERGDGKGRAPASAAVRELLRNVVDRLDDHQEVILGYGRVVERIRSTIRTAVETEKSQLAAALRVVAA